MAPDPLPQDTPWIQSLKPSSDCRTGTISSDTSLENSIDTAVQDTISGIVDAIFDPTVNPYWHFHVNDLIHAEIARNPQVTRKEVLKQLDSITQDVWEGRSNLRPSECKAVKVYTRNKLTEQRANTIRNIKYVNLC
jgi:hypothetical protein